MCAHTSSRRAAPLLPASLALTGCSLLVQGTSQDVTFTSDPPGISFTVAGQSATTPATLTLPKDDYRIAFEKQGFHPVEVELKQRTSPYFYGSLVMGVISSGVDLVTGAWKAFETTDVHVLLEPKLRRVRFQSTPAGAEVRVEGRSVGQTPTWADIEWRPAATAKGVEMALDGYRPVTLALTPHDEDMSALLEEVVESIPVNLRVFPSNAAIEVDGTATVDPPAPVVLEWSVSRDRHTLAFACPGYRPASRVLGRADARGVVEVRLQPVSPVLP